MRKRKFQGSETFIFSGKIYCGGEIIRKIEGKTIDDLIQKMRMIREKCR